MTTIALIVTFLASALALGANGVASLSHPGVAALRATGLYVCVGAVGFAAVTAVLSGIVKRWRHLFWVLTVVAFQVAAAGLALMYGSNGDTTDKVLGSYRTWSLYLSFFGASWAAWRVAFAAQNSILFVKIGLRLFFASFFPPALAMFGMLKMTPLVQTFTGGTVVLGMIALAMHYASKLTQNPP